MRHRRAAVAARVRQVHRRLEPRHQPPVAVRRRVGERRQRRRVLQDPADVVHRQLAHPAVPVARKQRLLPLPDALVAVHPAAVVPEDRLRHERHRLAVPLRHVLARCTCTSSARRPSSPTAETAVDLRLPRRRHLVVVLLHPHPHRLHRARSSPCGCPAGCRSAAPESTLPCSAACSPGSGAPRAPCSTALRPNPRSRTPRAGSARSGCRRE